MQRAAKTLEAMNRRLEDVRQRLAEEETLMAELRRDGQSTDDASRLLNEIKETLRLMEVHRVTFLRTHCDGTDRA
jgi:hypothetical protein